jgi:hypothetical protein
MQGTSAEMKEGHLTRLVLVLVAVMKIESSIVPVAGFGTNAVSAGPPRMWWIVVVVLSVFLGSSA